MGRIDKSLILGASAAALLMLVAARSPAAIQLASPGQWEFTGLPSAGGPARQCLADTGALTRLEHRGQSCEEKVISQDEASTLVHYTCANGGYGQTKVTMLTPRSLRIETQGISANYPFNYKIQARRVGECPAH